MFYLIELRDSDGNDVSVYDLLIEAKSQEKAFDKADAYMVETWPDDESDGNLGTFHPCHCVCEHGFPRDGIDCPHFDDGNDCDTSTWECSHGGLLLSEKPQSYSTHKLAMLDHSIYHCLVDLTEAPTS